jgi:hypothetical protein
LRQLVAVSAVALACAGAHAQSDTRARSGGGEYVLVQDLRCGRLAGTYIQNSDLVTTYLELGGFGSDDIDGYDKFSNEIMQYCGSHPDEKLTHAIGSVFDKARAGDQTEFIK